MFNNTKRQTISAVSRTVQFLEARNIQKFYVMATVKIARVMSNVRYSQIKTFLNMTIGL